VFLQLNDLSSEVGNLNLNGRVQDNDCLTKVANQGPAFFPLSCRFMGRVPRDFFDLGPDAGDGSFEGRNPDRDGRVQFDSSYHEAVNLCFIVIEGPQGSEASDPDDSEEHRGRKNLKKGRILKVGVVITIFGKKIGAFLENQSCDQIFAHFNFVLSHKHNFYANFLCENI
jgi:hypothetical protein